MKAVWYEELGPAKDVLQIGEVDDPQPAAGEVRVRLATSGINPVDVKRRQGGRGPMTARRVVPHFDGAGTIDAVGAQIPHDRVGERVWVYSAQWERDFGTAAELVTVPNDRAVPLPESTSFAEGACLGVPALTAYTCLPQRSNLTGQTVLITGGAGAVGRYAVQFARLLGAQTIATVSSEEKAELTISAGANYVINYRTEDVAARVLDITGGEGVDSIIEVEFGGNLETSVKILKQCGTITTYASQANQTPTIPFYELLYKSVCVQHVLLFQMFDAMKERALGDISRWLEEGTLTHVLGPSFALAETVAAHETVERGTIGKVLLDFGV